LQFQKQKKHTICKEIEASILALLHAFLTGMQEHLQQMPGDTLGGGNVL
jgi:hypothetical protein